MTELEIQPTGSYLVIITLILKMVGNMDSIIKRMIREKKGKYMRLIFKFCHSTTRWNSKIILRCLQVCIRWANSSSSHSFRMNMYNISKKNTSRIIWSLFYPRLKATKGWIIKNDISRLEMYSFMQKYERQYSTNPLKNVRILDWYFGVCFFPVRCVDNRRNFN